VRIARLVALLAVATLLPFASKGANGSLADSGAPCHWRAAAVEDPHPHLFDDFNSVTATASGKAWAVGEYSTGHESGPNGAFIEAWTGRRWELVGRPSPNARLWSVSASGPDNAWAAGDHLLEHWNGHGWRKVATAPVHGALLWGVATRGHEAWLVGERWRGRHQDGETLIERWNGNGWRVMSTPNPSTGGGRSDAILEAVGVRSASDAWAVGYSLTGRHMLESRTLIEHWDGRRWRIVPSPSARASDGVLYDILFGVTAVHAGDAWAVGTYESEAGGYGGGGDHALVLHWNGRHWSRADLPRIRERSFLHGILVRAGTAWAVGDRGLPPHRHRALVERWDGTRWTVARSPSGFDLAAASAPAHGTAWAVGAVGRRPLAAELACS
jgi:hypothetical protein